MYKLPETADLPDAGPLDEPTDAIRLYADAQEAERLHRIAAAAITGAGEEPTLDIETGLPVIELDILDEVTEPMAHLV